MPGLPVNYFRVVLVEPDCKQGTVWEFGDFCKLVDFVKIIFLCRVKSSRHVVTVQLRSVCGKDYHIMDKFFIDPVMLNLTIIDHPRRKAKPYEIEE